MWDRLQKIHDDLEAFMNQYSQEIDNANIDADLLNAETALESALEGRVM